MAVVDITEEQVLIWEAMADHLVENGADYFREYEATGREWCAMLVILYDKAKLGDLAVSELLEDVQLDGALEYMLGGS